MAEEFAYRVYVTDHVRFLAGNSGVRYADLFADYGVQETRTADEIKEYIAGKITAIREEGE